LPPLEAMRYGCPVVVSNSSSVPEVVGDAGQYFDPASTESIAAAVEAVVFDTEFKRRLIAKGYERIKQFTWDRCACETRAVYQQLV
ncbi:glycosyltransferase, partial [bacterium]|nr:glycosyltransferase [bacterium]